MRGLRDRQRGPRAHVPLPHAAATALRFHPIRSPAGATGAHCFPLPELEGLFVLRSLAVLILAWAGLLLLTPLVVAPSIDDGFFSAMPLIAFHLEDPALEPTLLYLTRFLILPGILFAQEFFYWPYLLLGLPYTYYTAKLLVIAINIALFALVLRLLRDSREESAAKSFFRGLLFLVVLCTSVYMEDVISIRPEGAGLLATMVGIVCVLRAQAGPRAVLWRAAAGLALAAAATTHPSFALTSAGLALAACILLWRREGWRALTVPIAAAAVPVLAMLAWYVLNAPESWDMLLLHVEERTPGSTYVGQPLVMLAKVVLQQGLEGQSALARLFLAATRAQILLITALAVLLVAVSLARPGLRRQLGDAHLYAAIVLLLALLNLVVQSSPRTQYLVVLSFAAALTLALYLPVAWLARPPLRALVSRRWLLLALGLPLLLTFPLSHAAKSMLSAEPRYHPRALLRAVEPELGRHRMVLVSDDRYLPAFLPQFEAGLRGGDGPAVHWIFPHYTTSDLARRGLGNIACRLQQQDDRPVLWIISDLFTKGRNLIAHDTAARRIDFSMHVGKSAVRIDIAFRYDAIVYRDRNTLAFSGRVARIGEQGVEASYEEGQERTACP